MTERLEALTTPRKSIALQYPLDLMSSKSEHYVLFTIKSINKPNYVDKTTSQVVNGVTNTNLSEIKTTGQSIKSEILGYISTAENYVASSIPKVKDALSSPSNAVNAVTNGITGAIDSVWGFLQKPGSATIVGHISLYMPDTITVAHEIEYNSKYSLTSILGTAGKVASTVEEGVSLGRGAASGGISDAFYSLAGNPAALDNLRSANLPGIDTEKLTDLVLNKAGFAVNPQLEVIFKQLDFRTFRYDFTFIPRSATEAESVTSIINTFRYHSLPGIENTGIGRYYTVPSIFDIAYHNKNGENRNINRIAPSVLTSIYVDYSPRSWVTHDDGMPAQIRLTMQFQEIEIVTKDKVREGY